MKQRKIYGVMVAGGGIGLLAAFLQTIEKLNILQDKGGSAVCNISDIFSCNTVLSAWQSSVFGFPNSLMCMVLFTIFGSVALVGAAGGKLTRRLRLGVQGLSLFTLGFALWFLWQSTFSIGALCIFCLFCFSGLLMVNWAWLRLNVDDLPIGAGGREIMSRAVKAGWDTLGWITLAVIIAAVMIVKFY